MDIATLAPLVPFFFEFISFGLLINFLQAVCYLCIRPVSKATFRIINGAVTELLWLHIVWLMQWWSGFRVQLDADSETLNLMGKEHALIISNHISETDMLTVWLLAQHFGCLRSALMMVKKSSKYLPVFGWALWFFEFVCLDRNWEKDEMKLKSSFQGLKDFPRPFWLTIFVEGTRLTPDKLHAAQQFAMSRSLPVPKHVMIPRTKGFALGVSELRSFVPALYDITLVVPKDHSLPSLLKIMKGQPSVVKVHVKRYAMEELPESKEGIAQWCRDKFVEKDALVEKFKSEGSFEDLESIEIGKSKKSLLVFICCAALVAMAGVKLCLNLSFLSTRKGLTLLGLALAVLLLFGHAFIEFTKIPVQSKKETTFLSKNFT